MHWKEQCTSTRFISRFILSFLSHENTTNIFLFIKITTSINQVDYFFCEWVKWIIMWQILSEWKINGKKKWDIQLPRTFRLISYEFSLCGNDKLCLWVKYLKKRMQSKEQYVTLHKVVMYHHSLKFSCYLSYHRGAGRHEKMVVLL